MKSAAKQKANRRRRGKRRLPPGSAPGEIFAEKQSDALLRVIQYDAEQMQEYFPSKVDQINWSRDSEQVTWVDVIGTEDPKTLRSLGKFFDLHPLALEDASNVPQRSKMDVYSGHCFFVMQMFHLSDRSTEQISIFLGHNFVITIQQRQGDCFGVLRERIRRKAKIRTTSVDYLAYAAIDAIVDTFFPLLESIAEEMDQIEERLIQSEGEIKILRIHEIKNDLNYYQRIIWGHRDFLRGLVRKPQSNIAGETVVYFRDCYDHSLQQLDLIDSYRETCTSLMDLVFSTANHETNQVVKVLTIVTSIFIPLSFIAGIYGMNFDSSLPLNMPETRSEWGYPVVLGFMFFVAISLLLIFRKRKWI